MIRLSTPEERVEMVRRIKSEGGRAIKLRLHYDTVAKISAWWKWCAKRWATIFPS
jgi:hypothetical protein